MKVFILGNGFIAKHLNYPIIPNKIGLNAQQIINIINEYKPDTLINCIGKTGITNTDWCEEHKELTSLINTALPILLANICQAYSIHLIHIGTGCIFSGDSPTIGGWKENDFANPISYYTKSKYASDLVLDGMKTTTVLRIRLPISKLNHPRNLINKIIGYKQVIDVQNSVTFMDDFVRCIDWFIHKHFETGIFHVVNPGSISMKEIAREYQKYIKHEFVVITEDQLSQITTVKRSGCILNTDKLNNTGFSMITAKEALIQYMKEYLKIGD